MKKRSDRRQATGDSAKPRENRRGENIAGNPEEAAAKEKKKCAYKVYLEIY